MAITTSFTVTPKARLTVWASASWRLLKAKRRWAVIDLVKGVGGAGRVGKAGTARPVSRRPRNEGRAEVASWRAAGLPVMSAAALSIRTWSRTTLPGRVANATA